MLTTNLREKFNGCGEVLNISSPSVESSKVRKCNLVIGPFATVVSRRAEDLSRRRAVYNSTLQCFVDNNSIPWRLPACPLIDWCNTRALWGHVQKPASP